MLYIQLRKPKTLNDSLDNKPHGYSILNVIWEENEEFFSMIPNIRDNSSYLLVS
jgi:hypothetical protein